jgi:hypothetical protein
MRFARNTLGAAAALAMGAGVAVVVTSSTERPAEAGSPGSPASPPSPAFVGGDGAAPSAFLARARRGEVAVPPLGEVERMCALLTSCDRLPIPPSLFPPDFGACVKKMMGDMSSPSAVNFSLTMRECGLEANSCASLRACALHGASPDSCKGRGQKGVVGFCDVVGRALTCWHDEVLSVRDCTRGSEQCLVVDGEATCTLGGCAAAGDAGDGARCSASGSHLLKCQKGKLASLDCSAFGLRCAKRADGAAGCATVGPACSDASKRCDGNVAVGCYNGHEVRVDCDAAGMSCAAPPGATPVGACAAPAAQKTECDAAEKARCEGGAIRYCYAGKARTLPCASAGLGKCDAAGGIVRCSP